MALTARPLAALVVVLVAVLVPAPSNPARTAEAEAASKVDLGTPRKVSMVKVSWRGGAGGRYRLQTSVDGRRFRTAARVRPLRKRPVRVRMANTTARFVRLAGRRERSPKLLVRAAASPADAWEPGPLPAPLPQSTGTRRYVATTGSDADPGTGSRPWRSIQHALELARPGDQVLVRGGTYTGSATGPDRGDGMGHSVYASPQGAEGAPITLAPHPGERAVIVGFVSFPRAAWFRMTGFVIDGADGPARAQGVSLGNTTTGEPRHVELSYNEIRNFAPREGHAQGILHYSGTDTALIGNRIRHIGRNRFYDHGIYLNRGRRVVVANNVISDVTGGYGLHIWGDFDDSWVIHNTVHASAASGFTIGGNAERGRPDRTTVANNVFSGHRGSDDSHQGYAAKEYQAGTGNSVRHNLGWGNVRSSAFALSATTAPRDNRTADPRFLSARSRDLRIAPGGAATDRGERLGLRLDATGQAREGRPDQGAYEARRG